jgi:hypothetical protein
MEKPDPEVGRNGEAAVCDAGAACSASCQGGQRVEDDRLKLEGRCCRAVLPNQEVGFPNWESVTRNYSILLLAVRCGRRFWSEGQGCGTRKNGILPPSSTRTANMR